MNKKQLAEIKIKIPEQKLYLVSGDKLIKYYFISTSKYGIGNKAGSNKTPLGLHRIASKIGRNACFGSIFKRCRNTGKIAKVNKDGAADLITTRILRLEGLQKGINKGKDIDSFRRCIYIHGTSEEKLIGKPASHGCIRMKNSDIMKLCSLVKRGTLVDIMKIIFLVIVISVFPILSHAVTYDDILTHKASDSRPFWGDHYEYKNIKWISHKPYFEDATDEQMKEMEQEMLEAVDERGQIDVGSVDFNGDGEYEYLKVRWTGYGGPAKGLIIEVYQDKELKNQIGFASPQRKGYHPNFKVEDVDNDGSLELVTFAGVPDPNMSSMYGDNKPFEPRFASMFLNVSIYKFTDGLLELSRQYLTKDKYEPHHMPDEGILPK